MILPAADSPAVQPSVAAPLVATMWVPQDQVTTVVPAVACGEETGMNENIGYAQMKTNTAVLTGKDATQ